MDIITKHLIIKGRVQGVFYRGWTVQAAQALGLAGWVRNLANGDVEVLVQGHHSDVARMIDLAWQGPAAARVDEIAGNTVEIRDLSGFEQR